MLTILANDKSTHGYYTKAFMHYLIGQSTMRTDPEEAVTSLETASRLFAEDVAETQRFSALVYEAETTMYAEIIRKDGNDSKAAKLFSLVLERRPSFAPAYKHLGMMAYCKGDFEAATDWAVKGIALNPLQTHSMLIDFVEFLQNSPSVEAVCP